MTPEAAAAAGHSVIFGIDPLWLSTILLIVSYTVLLSEKFDRTVVALIGAGLVIITGVISQEQAIEAIDFNTIALLTGMMIIVAITRTSGVFEFVAIWSAKKVNANPVGILIVLSVVTAVFSAFLDNLTTVLLVVPIALLIVEKLEVSPYPFLFSQILASNIGGTATLIGDPPNILIGSATGLTFMQFLTNLGPLVVVLIVIMVVVFKLLWGKGLMASEAARQGIMRFREAETITDKRLLVISLTVLALVIAGFIVGEQYHIQPGTTAMFGAAVLVLATTFGASSHEQGEHLHHALIEVEWAALLFFIGLFIIVAGVEHAGLLNILGDQLIEFTGGDPARTAYATLWLSAVVSAAVDNIPFVATMIPLVESMETALGGPAQLEPVWWALALGACLGGNGSLVGAAANVMVSGLAGRAGHPISFAKFMRIGLPLMLGTVAIANVYMWLRYF
ncbi:MAG: ArsB/NhaD family transporter [Rhodospirillaceae bacterium]|jgi:Na+/H+ antiporter NhaD/arsenite permease-like protein|nr:ArsB/NhaD family transporter [Rhodospirillaceae bacterium]MBT4115552.1 ArsB/NhaD family transporter [Rhodospirillaceae bacterium]MBT4672420.1 ArsB/NhaD family transporter [Rhodospirillaceae bacterium]MBT4717969.1 ArsB/NhaD family transporter [Rhodospirillaceae bacterium]MBT4751324.1 ArsB/NhaD family transporter [Rhodospirillaceae bacterium]